jgi:hypothetical protein
VKNRGQNDKVKKIKVKPQLHFKARARTPKNLDFVITWRSEIKVRE